MFIHKLTIFLILLFLSACTTSGPTPTENNAPDKPPVEISWEQAKEMIFSGQIESIVQSHDRKAILEHQNGKQFITVEPELDDVMKIVKQCGAKCADMSLMTE